MTTKTEKNISSIVTEFQESLGAGRVFCSMREAARITGLSMDTVRRSIDSQTLKSSKPKSGLRTRRLVRLSDLAAFTLGLEN